MHGFFKRSLLLLLGVLLTSWFLLAGSPAYALSTKQESSPSTCPSIPSNFDYAHATTQELHHYLLPARPATNDVKGMSNWQKDVVNTMKTGGICGSDPALHHPAMFHKKPVENLVNCDSTAPSGTVCYYNWNGWIVGNGTSPGFNEVVGQWNVECVTTGNSPSDSAQSSWIGLGGNDESNLWQAGTGWDPTNGYTVWYEAVGTNGTPQEEIIGHTSCGTHISADIWFAPGNPSSGVGFHIVVGSTSYRGSAPSGFSSGYETAEWIDERPACGTDPDGNPYLWKLADYNYSQWTAAQASPNNATAPFYPISSFANTRAWMERSDGSRIANATSLGSGGESFNGNWEDNGDSQCG